MKNPKRQSQSKAQPVHKISMGAVSASVWRQENEKGAMFNVTFQRVYKNGEGWKYASNFGRKDLLVLSFIAARAFEWIAGQAKSRAQQPKTEPATPPDDDVPF